MKFNPKRIWTILRETFSEFGEDRGPRHGAALAYYAVFALGPLVVVAVRIASAVVGAEAARGQLASQLQSAVGPVVAESIQNVVINVNRSAGTGVAMMASGIAILFGATGAVLAMKDALNTIWGVAPYSKRGWKGKLFDRLIGLLIVSGAGALLIASVALSVAVNTASRFAQDWLSYFPNARVTGLAISWIVVTLLFAMLLKGLPDARIRWRALWFGSAVTALLFLAGNELIGVYLARKGLTSTYGAAGSFVALMLWAYYSSQIFLLGAEFTQVYSRYAGWKAEPRAGGQTLTEFLRDREGIVRKHERMTAAHGGSEVRPD